MFLCYTNSFDYSSLTVPPIAESRSIGIILAYNLLAINNKNNYLFFPFIRIQMQVI